MGRNRTRVRIRILAAGCILLASFCQAVPAQRRAKAGAPANLSRTLTIFTEPNAVVWLDEIRRGTTDVMGKLLLAKISSGPHTLRVRAGGFREATMTLQPAQRGEVRVRLTRTSDEAELTFQQAENAREQARDDDSRQKVVELYRRTVQIRPGFPAAHVGLARVLMDLNDSDAALAEIEAARRYRPVYSEASAAEGRIYREAAQTDEAIGSFNRAIREGRGFQPEAHVGLGRVYEDKGQYDLAAREYEIAITQLSDTEPVIYQMLGSAQEKVQNYKEALKAYEKYLELAPNGSLAPAVRSIIDQIRAEAEGRRIVP
jgi:tetratricopeptide (TPR) repeat protein